MDWSLDSYLSVSQIELGRQLLAILYAQVLLLLKAPLEGLELVVRKGRPGLSLLPGIAVELPLVLVASGRGGRVGILGLVIVCK